MNTFPAGSCCFSNFLSAQGAFDSRKLEYGLLLNGPPARLG
jgi:hypothetical protein